MVKRVLTSIITLAVLMGVLVACSGTTQVVAPTPEPEPEPIVEEMDQTISNATTEAKSIPQVGIRFMKFCAKYDLNRISEQAQLYVEPFNARLVA